MDDSPGGGEEKGAREDPEGEESGSNARGCCGQVGQLPARWGNFRSRSWRTRRRESLKASRLLGLSLPVLAELRGAGSVSVPQMSPGAQPAEATGALPSQTGPASAGASAQPSPPR